MRLETVKWALNEPHTPMKQEPEDEDYVLFDSLIFLLITSLIILGVGIYQYSK